MATRRTDVAGARAVAAVEALTVDDLDDDAVTHDGIPRAVFDLVRRTIREHGGIPGRWGDLQARTASHSRRLVREAADLWDVVPDV